MINVDSNYISEESSVSYPELSQSEREEMLLRYLELLPKFVKKQEIIDSRGFAPMDVLHEIILSKSKQQAKSIERTLKTKAIRESQKKEEYFIKKVKYDLQPDLDIIKYVKSHECELRRVFNVKIID